MDTPIRTPAGRPVVKAVLEEWASGQAMLRTLTGGLSRLLDDLDSAVALHMSLDPLAMIRSGERYI